MSKDCKSTIFGIICLLLCLSTAMWCSTVDTDSPQARIDEKIAIRDAVKEQTAKTELTNQQYLEDMIMQGKGKK